MRVIFVINNLYKNHLQQTKSMNKIEILFVVIQKLKTTNILYRNKKDVIDNESLIQILSSLSNVFETKNK